MAGASLRSLSSEAPRRHPAAFQEAKTGQQNDLSLRKDEHEPNAAQTVISDSGAAKSSQLEHADAAATHVSEPSHELSPLPAAAKAGQGAVCGSHPPASSSPLTSPPHAAALPSGPAAPPLLPPAPSSAAADAASSSPSQRGVFMSSSFSSAFAQMQLAELAAAAAPPSLPVPSAPDSGATTPSVASTAALPAAQLTFAAGDTKPASAAAANAATAAMSPPLVQAVSSAVGTAHARATAIKVPGSAVATPSLPAATVAVRPAEINVCVNPQQASVPAAHLSHDTADTAALASQTMSAERTSKKWFAAKQTSFTDAKLFAEKWEIEAQSAMSSRVASASSQRLSVAAELSDGSTAGLLDGANAASHKVSKLSTYSWTRASACCHVWFLLICRQYSL